MPQQIFTEYLPCARHLCSCEDKDEEDRVPVVEDLSLSNPHMSHVCVVHGLLEGQSRVGTVWGVGKVEEHLTWVLKDGGKLIMSLGCFLKMIAIALGIRTDLYLGSKGSA